MSALDKVEVDKEAMCLQMAQVAQEIAAASIQRPTAGQVQEAWGEALRVWKVLTEDESVDLIGSVVQVVEMTEKESMALELLPVPYSSISHSLGFNLERELGAGRYARQELRAIAV